MATGRQGRARGFSIVGLRRWLLAGLLLLVAVLAGVLGYARYRARRLLADLPHRLGIDIKSETNGFTYSQTVKGRTVFTIHAAKAIQRENGKTTLHDVAITLYGPPGSNQTDSIRGAEFEYDQPNGVVRAMGETHLDLALPAQAGAPHRPGAERAQITTSGLIFLQKLGIAATDQPIHLVYGDMHGDAIGADFESGTGVLRLRGDVRLDGMQNGRSIHVDANAAEMDRNTQIAILHSAHVMADKERAAGETVVLALRKDGSVESVRADGHASVESDSGVHAEAPHLMADMNSAGRLETASMHGGVQLEAENGTGTAGDATLRFDAAGKPEHLLLKHAVELHGARASQKRSSTLTADLVDAQLGQEGTRTVLLHAIASGNAVFRGIGDVSGANSTPRVKRSLEASTISRTTIVRAATLNAGTALALGQRYISVIDGAGGTRVEESDTAGNMRVSTGDTLHAVLGAPGTGKEGSGTGTLQSAVQTGHVVITQHTVAAAAAPSVPMKSQAASKPQDSRAMAERAEFESGTQRLTLSGAPVVIAPGVQLAADRIALLQSSGDATAQGNVKGTFVQDATGVGKPDPVHVLADRAEIAGNSGLAHFHGTERAARMWSSTAQLQAGEIDLDRSGGTLAAHAGTSSAPIRAVHLTLVGAARAGAPAASMKSETKGPVDITGSTLLMTSATASAPGRIDVSGDVRMLSGTTGVTSDKLVATLRPSSKSNETKQDRNATVSAFNQGSIESITATGHVHLREPGRTGTGERLLYTAADDRYQLTGTTAALPRIEDSLRGNVTGTSLVFHGSDESIEVTGEAGKPARTETEAGRPARAR